MHYLKKKYRRPYHNGQVPETFNSHGSIHAGWYLWWQGKTRTSSPVVKSSVQIEHPNSPSVTEAAASGELDFTDSVSAGPMPDVTAAAVVAELDSGDLVVWLLVVAVAGVDSAVAWCGTPLPSSNSTLPGFDGSGSPNFTMGNVSNMALARPFALLCLGLPEYPVRGPYLSGCL